MNLQLKLTRVDNALLYIRVQYFSTIFLSAMWRLFLGENLIGEHLKNIFYNLFIKLI